MSQVTQKKYYLVQSFPLTPSLPLPVRDLLKLNRLDGAPDTKTAQQSLR